MSSEIRTCRPGCNVVAKIPRCFKYGNPLTLVSFSLARSRVNTTKNRFVIVPQTFPVQNLRDDEISLRELYKSALLSEDECLRWYAKYGLLKNERQCEHCERPMKLAFTQRRWRCEVCLRTVSVRKGSVVEGSKLPLTTVLELMYWWTINIDQAREAHETKVSRFHVGEQFDLVRLVCVRMMEEHPTVIGGPDRVVGIDESAFGKRK